MSLAALATTALFALTLVALWVAAVRVVSSIAPRGLERALAAVCVVGTFAVIESLALGFIHLGTNSAALSAGALVAVAAVWTRTPPPSVTPSEELAAWWHGAGPGGWILVSAFGGVWLAWAAWALLEPALGIDTTLFHLPQVAMWIEGGRPGTIELISGAFPVGNYPATNEVLLSWAGGLSRNVGVVLLWAPVSMLLLIGGLALGARSAGAGAGAIALAVAAVVTLPVVADAVTTVDTDLAASAWIAISVAFAVRSCSRVGGERLLVFSLLALGLAVGTKTTVAPLGLLVLAAGFLAIGRHRLPYGALVVSAALAAAVGGLWYLRNLISHGSPLWPFVSLPGSDPLPAGFEESSTRLIERPLATLEGNLDAYLQTIGAGPLLIVAALAAVLVVRERRVLIGGAVVLICTLLWTAAPFTGGGTPVQDLFAVSTTRYLMATVAFAAGMLAAVTARGGAGAALAWVALAGATVWGAVDLAIGRDGAPHLWVLLVGAGGGAAAGRLFGALASADRFNRRVSIALAAAATVLLIAPYPGSFADRYSSVRSIDDPLEDTRATFGELVGWFADQPEYREGSRPILFQPAVIGPLTGGGFEHALSLIPDRIDCAAVQARRRDGWIVLNVPPPGFGEPPPVSRCLIDERPIAGFQTRDGGELRVYGEGG